MIPFKLFPFPDHAPIYEFPRLRRLKIRDTFSFTILSKIRAPSLSALQIINPTSIYHDVDTTQQRLWTTFPQLIDFLEKWGSNIREFHLTCWFLQDNEALHYLLESLSSVRKLCLDTWFTGEPTCEDLEDTGAPVNPQELLPNIREICMHSRGVDPQPYRAKPFIRGPSYWRSFSTFLHSRSLAGTTTENDANAMKVANAAKPNLLVYLPNIKGVHGLTEAQLKAVESIRALDGISITIQTKHICDAEW
ncbi:hypothetical protein H1R20_g9715, partial [Candolleomyces eurysporus]